VCTRASCARRTRLRLEAFARRAPLPVEIVGLTVTVADDGVVGASASGGSGLRGLADRLAALDGTPASWRVVSNPAADYALIGMCPGWSSIR
jgi:hypothetical protein